MPGSLIKVVGVQRIALQSVALALLLCLLAGRASGESGSGGQLQEAVNANPNGKKIAFAVEDQYQANASENTSDPYEDMRRGKLGSNTASAEGARAGRAGAGWGVVAFFRVSRFTALSGYISHS